MCGACVGHVYVCVSSLVWTHRQQPWLKCYPLGCCLLPLIQGFSLVWSSVIELFQPGQGAPGILLSCLPSALVIMPDFLCGCCGFNADTQVCEASTLPIKSNPQAQP